MTNVEITLKNIDCSGKNRGHVFDFVWILIAISKHCQGTRSYQVQVQSNQPSFILKDFSHSDKRRFRMQISLDT